MIPEQHKRALKIIHARVENSGINWVVTGSVSFCLQGVPLTPNDIDIQTDEKGAYEIEELFSQRIIREVKFSSTERIKSHFGAFELEGVVVEIMGDVQKFYDGKWEEPIDIDRHKKYLTFEGIEVPVLDLSYEAKAYRRYGRLKRAEELECHAANDGLSNKC